MGPTPSIPRLAGRRGALLQAGTMTIVMLEELEGLTRDVIKAVLARVVPLGDDMKVIKSDLADLEAFRDEMKSAGFGDLKSDLDALGEGDAPKPADPAPQSETEAPAPAAGARRGAPARRLTTPTTHRSEEAPPDALSRFWSTPHDPQHRLSRRPRALMAREGCRLTAYRDSVGVPTIGVGHTGRAGPPPVSMGMTITRAQADAIFAAELGPFEDAVAACVPARRRA